MDQCDRAAGGEESAEEVLHIKVQQRSHGKQQGNHVQRAVEKQLNDQIKPPSKGIASVTQRAFQQCGQQTVDPGTSYHTLSRREVLAKGKRT